MFELLMLQVAPMYALIALGFLLARFKRVDVRSVADIVLYAILPVLMFGAAANAQFHREYLIPPFIIASISIVASFMGYGLSYWIWGAKDSRVNLIGLLGVSCNSTYFGVPVALALGGTDWANVYMLMVLPMFILDCTLAYFFAARSRFSIADSIKRVLKLPVLYGVIAGMVFNGLGYSLSPIMLSYWERFSGAVIILGMMLIGMALAPMKRLQIDLSFVVVLTVVRYCIWPCLGFAWVFFDIVFWQQLPEMVHAFIVLICACPLAANSIAYTTSLQLKPDLNATVVLCSTVLALFVIPAIFFIYTHLRAFL